MPGHLRRAICAGGIGGARPRRRDAVLLLLPVIPTGRGSLRRYPQENRVVRMLWIRGVIFTLLVPGLIGVYVPSTLYGGAPPRSGWWMAGWLPVVAGTAVYNLCLLRFLLSSGTPAIFFTRDLGFLIGEEPSRLVQQGLYRVSRNPMYIGVLLVVFGQAILFASLRVAEYGFALWLLFHVVVVFLEEPHLRRERGQSYDDYCRQVPRWL